MMKAFKIIVALATIALVGCNEYNEILGQKVKAALGENFKDFQIVSYPTNNFGTGTAYRTTDNLQLCDMWHCLGVADKDVPKDFAAWLQLSSYVGFGGNGALITLNETESRNFTIGAVVPKVVKLLKLDANLDGSNITKTELVLGRAYPRKIRPDPWVVYMNSLSPVDHKLLKTAFSDGNLTVVVEDVVLESMKATITVDKAIGGKLDAAIDVPMGAAKEFIENSDLDGIKLKLSAKKETDGVYTFEVAQPVIVLTKATKQSGGGALAIGSGYSPASAPDKSK